MVRAIVRGGSPGGSETTGG